MCGCQSLLCSGSTEPPPFFFTQHPPDPNDRTPARPWRWGQGSRICTTRAVARSEGRALSWAAIDASRRLAGPSSAAAALVEAPALVPCSHSSARLAEQAGSEAWLGKTGGNRVWMPRLCAKRQAHAASHTATEPTHPRPRAPDRTPVALPAHQLGQLTPKLLTVGCCHRSRPDRFEQQTSPHPQQAGGCETRGTTAACRRAAKRHRSLLAQGHCRATPCGRRPVAHRSADRACRRPCR